jgi:hypothetical protein
MKCFRLLLKRLQLSSHMKLFTHVAVKAKRF